MSNEEPTTNVNSSVEIFYIHYNYDRPFRVSVDAKRNRVMVIYNDTALHYNPEAKNTHSVLMIYSKNVFIGYSGPHSITRFSRGHGDAYRGNTILVETRKPLQYVWIGGSVKCVKTKAPIVEYVSPVGNNDLPYPWAIDEQGNYYLFLDDTVLLSKSPNDETPLPERFREDDPYEYFYRIAVIIDIERSSHEYLSFERRTIHAHYANMIQVYLDDEPFRWQWVNDPDKYYEHLISIDFRGNQETNDVVDDESELPVYRKIMASYLDGRMRVVSKQEFVRLSKEFGVSVGLERMDCQILCPRYGTLFSTDQI